MSELSLQESTNLIVDVKTKVHFRTMVKSNFHSCKSLFKLFFVQYINNPTQWFYDVAFSLFFLAFFGYMNLAMIDHNLSISGSNGSDVGNALLFKDAMIGLISLQLISVGSFSMPTAIMEIKTSVLMKRIGSTPIKPWMFILSAIVFYVLLVIALAIWVMFWVFILFGFQNYSYGNNKIKGYELLFGSTLPNEMGGINWGGMIYAFINLIVTSICIGLFNVSTSRTSSSANIKGTMIYFVSMFLSGMLFSIAVLKQNQVLNVLSYATPFRYVNVFLNVSWQNGNIFNVDNPFVNSNLNKTMIDQLSGTFTTGDLIASFIVPIVILIISVFVMIKCFKWNVR